MPVYNCATFLDESISSILAQTYTDFEFIITDDCSSDSSPDIIKKYSAQDNRIVARFNEKNRGVTKTLNDMILQAKGTYIARMDADDISLSQRFALQLKSVDETSSDTVFSHAILINSSGGTVCTIYTPPLETCLKFIPYSCLFIHPTAFIRKDVFLRFGMYNEKFLHGQDWDLWKRVHNNIKFSMVTEPLLKYRMNFTSITFKRLGKESSKEDYESAKACLRNFDYSKFIFYLHKTTMKQRILLLFLRFTHYYHFKYYNLFIKYLFHL
jgi:glycosyltransferase involved in cell wall biosynthesis